MTRGMWQLETTTKKLWKLCCDYSLNFKFPLPSFTFYLQILIQSGPTGGKIDENCLQCRLRNTNTKSRKSREIEKCQYNFSQGKTLLYVTVHASYATAYTVAPGKGEMKLSLKRAQ